MLFVSLKEALPIKVFKSIVCYDIFISFPRYVKDEARERLLRRGVGAEMEI